MDVDYKALKNGGFMRQKQKNHFSLRLKVVGGNLSAAQLLTVAGVARKYGRDKIHLTARQGVEIPFIKLEDVEKVKAELAAGGVETGVCGPRVRTVTACQGQAVCPSGCIDTYPLALEISERYFGRALPHKFKFGVTGCVNNCLKTEENDLGVKGGYSLKWSPGDCTLCGVCLKACRSGALSQTEETIELTADKCDHCGRCVKACPTGAWQGEPAYILSFGGTFGNLIAPGRELLPLIPDRDRLFRVMDAAVAHFAATAQPGERFRQALDRAGWEGLIQAVQEAANA